jgi:hypothetical protein
VSQLAGLFEATGSATITITALGVSAVLPDDPPTATVSTTDTTGPTAIVAFADTSGPTAIVSSIEDELPLAA